MKIAPDARTNIRRPERKNIFFITVLVLII